MLILLQTDNSYLIWIAVISSLCTLGLALIGLIPVYLTYKNEKDRLFVESETKIENLQKKLSSATQEIQLDRQAFGLRLTIEQWAEIDRLKKKLFSETSVERILFLRGWNGESDVKYTTAVYQIRSDRSMHEDYIHYPIREDYREHLNEAKRKSIHFITVKDLLPDSQVAEVYNGEVPPIRHTAWKHLKTQRVDERRAIVTYCSMSSFEDTPFSSREKRCIQSVGSALEAVFNNDDLIHLTK